MLFEAAFTKDNLDTYLKALAKEFRRLNGTKIPAEIILVGGASILVNYGFREMTYDIDAVVQASSVMKDAINCVGDKHGLPNGWLNTDCTRTRSYSTNLAEVSVFYKELSNILTVRTVAAEYLIAMKLMSGRLYKNDLSDVAGILWEHQKKGTPITYGAIDQAVVKLYGNWDSIPQESTSFIEAVFEKGDFETFYKQRQVSEKNSREVLLDFKKQTSDTLTENNLVDVLEKAKRMRQQERNDGK